MMDATNKGGSTPSRSQMLDSINTGALKDVRVKDVSKNTVRVEVTLKPGEGLAQLIADTQVAKEISASIA